MNRSDLDVTALLAAQHGRIRALFHEAMEAEPSQRVGSVGVLRRYLALHEAAERVALHEVSRSRRLASADESAQRVVEENEMATGFEHLAGFSPQDPFFVHQLGLLEEAAGFHAEDEESKELPGFLATAPRSDVERLATTLARVDAAFDAGETKGDQAGTFAEQVAAAEELLRAG